MQRSFVSPRVLCVLCALCVWPPSSLKNINLPLDKCLSIMYFTVQLINRMVKPECPKIA